MRLLVCNLLTLLATVTSAQPTLPQQSLNQYVAFLNQSADAVASRFQMLRTYQDELKRYAQRKEAGLQLPSSGPLDEFYYQKALAATGFTTLEKAQLTGATQAVWQRLNQIDRTAKALETYVRLRDYERDNLSRSDALLTELQMACRQFNQDKQTLYAQVERLYRKHQSKQVTNPYLATEREMVQVLLRHQQLLDSLPYVLDDTRLASWPVERVQRSLLTEEAQVANFGKFQAGIAYPASDMIGRFKGAWQTIQALKRHAVNDYNVAARQSARHGNEFYRQLINHFNSDLLASYQAFIQYSQSVKALLDYPKYSPTFLLDTPVFSPRPVGKTAPFADQEPLTFTVKTASTPISQTTFATLNSYVDVINESLQQMHQLQVLVRNYQSLAAGYRDPARSNRRADLEYSHEAYKIPVSDYQLLLTNSRHIPAIYRPSLIGQLDILQAILREMDALSIELTDYTVHKQYERDGWQRSDEILDRYALLFEVFDRKKEQLYTDVRRVFESYPVANPQSSWNKAGHALLKLMDDDRTTLFGIKDYLKLQTAQLPATESLETGSRQAIANEYQNLSGLTRLGRSNGLCPYTPYEDLAENTLRFAQLSRNVRPVLANTGTHPYQSFYFFYNNELVYEYNKFVELSKEPLLKMVNQPDLFVFQRQPVAGTAIPPPAIVTPSIAQTPSTKPASSTTQSIIQPASSPSPTSRDTVYLERTRTDTVYIDRTRPQEVVQSLEGYAPNNMVLLLDVSGSMEAPVKLPLLKRSIKSLLKLLRPSDQISVVVYSGKAKLALKSTSGADADEIARVIDGLKSDGDTDGNGGLKLAYKVADRNYIRAGNNRIILATDGEFPVSDDVRQLIADYARQDIYLTVFTFGRNPLTGQNLKSLSQLGRGSYTHVTPDNANLQLILEAQAKRLPTR